MPFCQQVKDECATEVPMTDTKGHVGDTESSSAPSQLEEDDSAAAEMNSPQDSEKHQFQCKENTNTTDTKEVCGHQREDRLQTTNVVPAMS